MAYLTVKKVKGHYYAYQQESYREGGKVRTRTLSYFGAIDPATAGQLSGINKLLSKSEKEELIKSVCSLLEEPEKDQIDTQVVQNGPILKDNSQPKPKTGKKPDNTIQMKVNVEQALIDAKTGEIIKIYSKVITTQDAQRPFPQLLTLPSDLANYGLSEAAISRTHARYGDRLNNAGIANAHLPKIKIAYGHPDRLKRERDGSYTIYASRRTQNKRHPIAKARMWQHYRQALSAAYVDAIQNSQPERFQLMRIDLDQQHKAAKKLIIQSYALASWRKAKWKLSLQLVFWDTIPREITSKAKPEDFGQIDFSLVNDWRGEVVHILSEVQKSGWSGFENRANNAKRRLKSSITRKRCEVDKMRFVDKLSGKRRKVIREILTAEARLKSAEHLADRIQSIKSHLPDF